MDLSIFPTTASAVYTVAGAAVICLVLTQWLKKYLPDWRYTNLLALGLTFVIVEIAGGAFVTGVTLWERLYVGFLVALAGASLPTFGYELLTNLAGIAGVGPRANPPAA